MSLPLHRRDLLRGLAAASVIAAQPAWVDGAVSYLAGGTDDQRRQWWRDARFGMFVHWGLYAILAGEWQGRTDYAEWIRNNAKIPIGEYDTLLARFNPTQFSADAFAKTAADAGAKYLVITSKHHDGFALFNSKAGPFNVMSTPFKRDIMKEIAAACRRHGVTPCWYHSIMDWHHPDYLPRRQWEAADRPASGAVYQRFVDYLNRQVEELLTNYGDIGVMWFDGQWESTWTRELGQQLFDKCRALQPNVLVNNRVAPGQTVDVGVKQVGKAEIGDFGTPEQAVPEAGLPGTDWESCITMNGNWGYNRADKKFKSVEQIGGLLFETASKGGNLLLNVGPTGEGVIPEESVTRLQRVGVWMRKHAGAIRGTRATPFERAPFRATTRDRSVFVFLPEWPADRNLLIPRFGATPTRARMMGDRVWQNVQRVDTGTVVRLPERAADPVCSVLELETAR
ncbi:MAG: alpha-L-fucosidase [Acidobacteriota bacterium]